MDIESFSVYNSLFDYNLDYSLCGEVKYIYAISHSDATSNTDASFKYRIVFDISKESRAVTFNTSTAWT
jgi:hypothetical protein